MKLPVSLTQKVSRSVLIIKKHSPHIFFTAGVVGSVASTVLACRATLKLSEELDRIRIDLENVDNHKQLTLNGTLNEAQTLEAMKEHKKDLVYVYTKGGVRLTKLYAPAVILGVASITALTGSHVQMSRRNASLMAAYAALQRAYDDYRARIREELGDERELEIYHAVQTDTIDKKKVKSADPNTWSPYAAFFDEYSKYWEKDPELNRLYVQCQQNYANNLLRARGHIFLNEVYDMLGVERSKAGAVVGWVIGESGDNYVDFGIYEAFNSRFVNGIERSIILDFNVDGVIYDKI